MAADSAAASSEAVPEPGKAPSFDTSVAHVARVYNYWLGGKDNFAADLRHADQILAKAAQRSDLPRQGGSGAALRRAGTRRAGDDERARLAA
jgi:hypothetical protein